ncbi:hypothetical protein MRX96_032168 [Rhipicephalus microplus]
MPISGGRCAISRKRGRRCESAASATDMGHPGHSSRRLTAAIRYPQQSRLASPVLYLRDRDWSFYLADTGSNSNDRMRYFLSVTGHRNAGWTQASCAQTSLVRKNLGGRNVMSHAKFPRKHTGLKASAQNADANCYE